MAHCVSSRGGSNSVAVGATADMAGPNAGLIAVEHDAGRTFGANSSYPFDGTPMAFQFESQRSVICDEAVSDARSKSLICLSWEPCRKRVRARVFTRLET